MDERDPPFDEEGTKLLGQPEKPTNTCVEAELDERRKRSEKCLNDTEPCSKSFDRQHEKVTDEPEPDSPKSRDLRWELV